jgi:hypothetical protein
MGHNVMVTLDGHPAQDFSTALSALFPCPWSVPLPFRDSLKTTEVKQKGQVRSHQSPVPRSCVLCNPHFPFITPSN